MNIYDVIKKPLVTEKAMASRGVYPCYAFVVDRRADKIQIRQAVEKLFGVHVLSVNTSVVPGKKRRVGRFVGMRPTWKKALVVLKEGEKIQVFEAA